MTTFIVGPNTAYPTISAAMANAVTGDTISLSPGYGAETAIVTVDGLTFDGDASSTGIVLSLAPDVDGVTLSGTASIDVDDSASDSTITGNDGDNEITVSGGVDTVDGGSGIDRLVVDYSDATGATVGSSATGFIGNAFPDGSVASVSIVGAGFEDYTVLMGTGVNTVTTAGGDDIIVGNGIAANTIVAGEGDNLVQTGDGIDTINTGSGNDRIESGDGASTIVTTGGDNFIETGIGIDTILVGDGADIILGGDGANTITGLGGDKHILTGDGIDTITLTDGNNQIVTGEGASTTVATHGDNTVCAGSGVDTITLGNGDNIVKAGDGANTVAIGHGENAVWGGAGIDTITVGDGGNYIDGGEGPANTLTTGGGNDTVISGTGVDTITTGGGDDKVLITGGADVIAGGIGSDTLVVDYSAATNDVITSVPSGTFDAGYSGTLSGMGAATYAGIETFDITSGSGNDAITGGHGDDIFDTGTGDDSVYAGAGSDYIYGNGGDTVDGGEGGSDSDTLNLGLNAGNHQITYDPLNSENGTVLFLDSGETLSFTNIENIVYEAPLPPTITIRDPDPDMCMVPCFTPGTSVETSLGKVLVEGLKVGDLVLTRDNGFKPIVWIGTKPITRKELAANDALQPILIRRGSLGENCPDRDMTVSRQHRMLMAGASAELLFGSCEVIVKANHMVNLPGVSVQRLEAVTYLHILFDQHEIILANDAWTESFQPGDSSVSAFDAGQMQELGTIFPELLEADQLAKFGCVRPSLNSQEAFVLFAA
jgi:Ca2+-binding RTX toxin-like protein